ncbi:8260_t:CDS:2 [Acaulospora morrowiae]|uniref:8260_t:CDS:1 n=1 Tax=Acaulospora morrowiae TaxID=94023 RepID=A0A9N9DN35_9GLOM|nr:8260_t:CDS:2 [Acaulospora morrowiae]
MDYIVKLLQPHRPYMPDEWRDEYDLEESSGFKFQRAGNTDVFVTDMCHGQVLWSLRRYF